MKFTGDKLQKVLKKMDDSNKGPFVLIRPVSLITPDGTELRSVSPGYALRFVQLWDAEGEFQGIGKNGVIHTVRANEAPGTTKRQPLFLRRNFAAEARANALRRKHAWRNFQDGLEWKQQPMSADSGRVGRLSTIHLPH